jgi:hypothetical protein
MLRFWLAYHLNITSPRRCRLSVPTAQNPRELEESGAGRSPFSIGNRSARVKFDCSARGGIYLPSTSVSAIAQCVHCGWA